NAETIIQLSKIDNIVSVKEASGDLEQVSDIIEHTADDFRVYSGEDSMTLPMLSLGADGVASVASHIAGREMEHFVRACHRGQARRATSVRRTVVAVRHRLYAQPSPVPGKTALNMKGLNVGSVRLPLVPLTDSESETLKNLIQQ